MNDDDTDKDIRDVFGLGPREVAFVDVLSCSDTDDDDEGDQDDEHDHQGLNNKGYL